MNIARFGAFELDVRGGILRKSGIRIHLQEQPTRLLIALLEQRGEVVTREALKARLWPADTFVDFDHSMNTAVRKLRTALDDSAATPRFIETTARRGYRFIATVEWTERPKTLPRPARRDVLSAISLTLLVAASVALLVTNRTATRGAQFPTVAVLPFTTSDPALDHISHGLYEAILGELSASPNLQVMTAAAGYAPRLTATATVRGAVKRDPSGYRMNVELVDAKGVQIWRDEYSGDASVIQRHCAADLAFRLGASAADRRPATKSADAYELYLRGRHQASLRTPASLLRAVEYFDRAVHLDPQFALAYASLGNAYGLLYGTNAIQGSNETLIQKSMAAVDKALSIDDTVAEAYASRAATKTTYYWDFAGAERDFRRAIELNPGYSRVHQWYASHLSKLGRFDEAQQEIDLARRLDPFSAAINSYVCWIRFYARRYDDALAFNEQLEKIDPRLVDTGCTASCLTQKGDDERSIAVGWNASDAEDLRQAFQRGGRDELWRERLRKLQRGSPTHIGLAMVYAALRDRDHAFEQLELGFQERQSGIVQFYVDPRLDNLRSDPRFDALARRIGIPQVAAPR